MFCTFIEQQSSLDITGAIIQIKNYGRQEVKVLLFSKPSFGLCCSDLPIIKRFKFYTMQQSKKKLAKTIKPPAPKPLTKEEKRILKWIFLPGWHFDDTIKPFCIKLGDVYIGHSVEDKTDRKYVTVYGIKGNRTIEAKDNDGKEEQQSVVVNYIIKDGVSIYQETVLTDLIELIAALKREHEIDNYDEKYVWGKK